MWKALLTLALLLSVPALAEAKKRPKAKPKAVSQTKKRVLEPQPARPPKKFVHLSALASLRYRSQDGLMYPAAGLVVRFDLIRSFFVRAPVEVWLTTDTSGGVRPAFSGLGLVGKEWNGFFVEAGAGGAFFGDGGKFALALQADIGYFWRDLISPQPVGLFLGYRLHTGSLRESLLLGGISLPFF